MTGKICQSEDDSWTFEVQHDSGLIEPPVLLGKLSKEQAQKEAVRRMSDGNGQSKGVVFCYDKRTMKAIRENRIAGIQPLA